METLAAQAPGVAGVLVVVGIFVRYLSHREAAHDLILREITSELRALRQALRAKSNLRPED